LKKERFMQAYEFLAKPENGAIPIPRELRNRITSRVKAIVLEGGAEELGPKERETARKSDMLLRPTLNTDGWKFSREEANDR